MGNDEKNPTKDKSVLVAIIIAVVLIFAVVGLPRLGQFIFFFDGTEETTLPPEIVETTDPILKETETPSILPDETEAPVPPPGETEAPVSGSVVNETESPDTPDETEVNTPHPPIIGTVAINPPLRFGIESWDDDTAECSPTVTIYGVIVSHGTPPYTFTFWTQKEPYISTVADIKQVLPLENSRDYVEFVPPVVVAKGRYKHVVLVFRWANGQEETTWIDDLFYPLPNHSCN
jgi:hypothetical protein